MSHYHAPMHTATVKVHLTGGDELTLARIVSGEQLTTAQVDLSEYNDVFLADRRWLARIERA